MIRSHAGLIIKVTSISEAANNWGRGCIRSYLELNQDILVRSHPLSLGHCMHRR